MRPARDRHLCKRVLTGALLVALAVAEQACSRSDAARDDDGRPRVLRIGWSPSEEEPERRVRLDVLRRYLSEQLNMPVQMIEVGSYSTEIEALRANKIDIGSMGPMAYVIARENAPVEPLVAQGQPDGERNTYRSCFVVPPGSPLHSIDDVKARAAELTLAFVDPASTSGHLVPRARLEAEGLVPENDFKQVIFSMNHLASVMTVKSGRVDVAAISTNTLKRLVEKGRIAADDVRVIWRSEPMFTGVWVVNRQLPSAFRDELRRVYVDFPTAAPDDWARYSVRHTVPNTVWVAAVDSDFDSLRELARSVKHLDLLD